METAITSIEPMADNITKEAKPHNKIFERVKLRYDNELCTHDSEKLLGGFHTEFDNHTNFTEHSNYKG